MEHNVVQSENAITTVKSSALTALAAVATRLGVATDVEQLRRQFHVGTEEPATHILIAMARSLGLEAKSMQLTFADLPRLSKALPAILRAKEGGALLLEAARSHPMKGSVAIVRDPSSPESELVAVEEIQLSKFWQGEIILVKRVYVVTDDQQPFGLAWITGQVLRERKIFREIFLGACVATVFAIAPPFVFRIVIDRVLVNNSYQTLNVLVGIVLIMMIAETILGHVRRILTQVVGTRIDGRLNLYIVEKLLKLPLNYFENNPTGRTLSKLQTMVQIRYFLSGQLFGALLDAVPLLGLIPVMLILEWHLALISFALAGLVFATVMIFLPSISRAHHRVIAAEHAKTAHLVETLYGIRTIKSLCLEGRRKKEWDVRVSEAAAERHRLGLITNWPQTLSLPVQRLIYSGCFAIGAYMVLGASTSTSIGVSSGLQNSTLTAGALVAFAMLSVRLASPLISLATLQLDFAEVRGAISQIATVMNVPPEIAQVNGLKLPVLGEITFSDIRFRYSPTSAYALDGVSFTVPRGTMLGIMGRSGSGKTTVTRLLQRLHTGYEGMIKIDGMDLKEIDLMHLRTSIGVVPQENFLFSGSIRDNIGMARPDASFLDIVRAAQLSGAEEFIEQLPRGYDTILEEGATNLSGGQRQRLAIARALLIDPPVLVLDEATSALDAESEAVVNANLKRIAKGRTVISISHRLSMLVEADAILVLERGKVYDIGTHEELLQRCDIYKHMWYQQNRHLRPRESGDALLLSGSTA
jgi:subfamily B ATP-binding cassette protein HlyB/CyaB